MIAVGLDPATSLGRALREQGIEEGDPGSGERVVVCAAAGSPVEIIDAALEAGGTVLVEAPNTLPAEQAARLADDGRVYSGLDYRYDPSLQRASAAIRAGSIGLAWAANAEIVWPEADADAAAANALDALSVLVAVRPVAAVRLPGDVTLLAITFEQGIVGTIAAIPRPPDGVRGVTQARIQVHASHGAVEVALGGPRLVSAGSRPGAVQIEQSGATRVLDAFAQGAAPLLGAVVSTLECVRIEEGVIT